MKIHDESDDQLKNERRLISYDEADAILRTMEVFPGIYAIRLRPKLYVGRLDDPTLLNRLIQMALCIAVDEAADGCCTEIRVQVADDWRVTVRDNGRGVSMTPDRHGQVLMEKLLTQMLSGPMIPEENRKQVYWGIGLVTVNALSEWVRVRNFRDGICWVQEYRCDDHPLAPFARESIAAETGLELTFQPDVSILSNLHFDPLHLAHWVNDRAAGFASPEISGSGVGKSTTMVFRTSAQ